MSFSALGQTIYYPSSTSGTGISVSNNNTETGIATSTVISGMGVNDVLITSFYVQMSVAPQANEGFKFYCNGTRIVSSSPSTATVVLYIESKMFNRNSTSSQMYLSYRDLGAGYPNTTFNSAFSINLGSDFTCNATYQIPVANTAKTFTKQVFSSYVITP